MQENHLESLLKGRDSETPAPESPEGYLGNADGVGHRLHFKEVLLLLTCPAFLRKKCLLLDIKEANIRFRCHAFEKNMINIIQGLSPCSIRKTELTKC